MFAIKEEIKRLMLDDFIGDVDQVTQKIQEIILEAKQCGYEELEFDAEGRYLILFGERLEAFEEVERREQEEKLQEQKAKEQSEQDELWERYYTIIREY